MSFEAGDTEQTMTRAMNALYVADTIGQLAVNGVAIANQWNLANGTTGSGTDYGLISLEAGTSLPQYEAMVAWSRAGSALIPVSFDDSDLRVYATTHGDGRLTAFVLNLSGEELVRTVRVLGAPSAGSAGLTKTWTDDLAATSMPTESVEVAVSDGELTIMLPPWSINVLELDAP